MRIGPLEILLILGAVAALFGMNNLPKFGKKAGETLRAFKENSSEITDVVKVIKEEADELKNAVTFDLSEKEANG